MTCPRCFADFDAGLDRCPECGVRFVRSVSGVLKTSAVMIAASGAKGFYRSVQEVPEPLRSRLREITTSANSGTIVIADQAGKEQIPQVIGRRESTGDLAAVVSSGNSKERPGGRETGSGAIRSAAPGSPLPLLGSSWMGTSWLGLPLTAWSGIILLLAAVAIIVAAFEIH